MKTEPIVFLLLNFYASTHLYSNNSIEQKDFGNIAWISCTRNNDIEYVAEWCTQLSDVKGCEQVAIDAFVDVYKNTIPKPFTLKQLIDGVNHEIQQFDKDKQRFPIVKISCNNVVVAGMFCEKLCPEEMYIERLFVRPDHQRKGIATKLILSIYQKYPEIKKIILLVRRSNAGACLFYKKLGFTEYNYLREGFDPKLFIAYCLFLRSYIVHGYQ